MSRRRTSSAGALALAPVPGIKPNKVHGRQLEEVREKDPEGRIVVHHRTVDTLRKMLRAGTITPEMHDAGREFQTAFGIAGLDPLRAASLLRVPGLRGEPHPAGRQLDERGRVHTVITALGGHGSPAASCIWSVLGHQMSLHQWALRQRWGGRAVRPDQAAGVLVAALGVLAAQGRQCTSEHRAT